MANINKQVYKLNQHISDIIVTSGLIYVSLNMIVSCRYYK